MAPSLEVMRRQLFGPDAPSDQRSRLARSALRLAAKVSTAHATLSKAPKGPDKAKALNTLRDVAIELLRLAEKNAG